MLFLILGLLGVVGLAYFVWFFWALARLFPSLGLPAGSGWVPVWNQWVLIGRGGMPGWLVLLGFVPGLSVVVVVVWGVAIARIHREFGVGAGMTVLGIFLPPLWATVLGVRLRGEGVVSGDQVGVFAGGPGSVEFGGERFASSGGFGVPPAPAPAGVVPPVPSAPVPAGVVPPAPSAPVGVVPPVPSAPVPAGVVPPAPSAPVGVVPPAPSAPAGVVPPAPSAPAPAPVGVVPPVPSAPAPQEGGLANPWGFGNTTEDNYQRLANESIPPRAQSLSAQEVAQPFSWPEVAPLAPTPPAVPVNTAWAPSAQAVESAVAAPLGSVLPAPSDPLAVAMPETVEETRVTVPSAPQPAPCDDDSLDQTVVVSARSRWALELSDGQRFELGSDDVVVGRAPVALEGSTTLLIPDSKRTLSKSHVRLRFGGEGWSVEDLHSTNGVFTVDSDGVQHEVTPGVAVLAGPVLMIGVIEVRLLELR